MEWIVLALAILVAGASGAFIWHRMTPWRLVKARRVVVNLHSGQAISGLLVRQSGPLLFLAQAQLLEDNVSMPLDGEAIVERHTIDFIQIL